MRGFFLYISETGDVTQSPTAYSGQVGPDKKGKPHLETSMHQNRAYDTF